MNTCSITMANNGRVITAGAADSLATQRDDQQYSLDEGPCLQAMHDLRIIDAADLTREDRWDGYPPAALPTQIGSIYYSSPLIVAERAIGVLNRYCGQPPRLRRGIKKAHSGADHRHRAPPQHDPIPGGWCVTQGGEAAGTVRADAAR
ncbi:MAG: hypothetical protein ACR2P2_02835 [Nakamurella sp.]